VSKVITEAGYVKAAQLLGVETAVLKAVIKVEANGSGFLSDGRAKILFEAHQFSKFTGRKYDVSHPTISSPRWNRALYKGGAAEYTRLEKAKQLNEWAALISTSWGLGQIMGFNHKACGYPAIKPFVADMQKSADLQLMAMVKFIKNNPGMVASLRAKNWARFANAYNGSGYKLNKYDTKLAAAYGSFA